MKQLLIELEDDVAERLEEVAPARSRKRSEFIRAAVNKALWDLEEKATEEAYHRLPDQAADAYIDPQAWEPAPGRRPRQRR